MKMEELEKEYNHQHLPEKQNKPGDTTFVLCVDWIDYAKKCSETTDMGRFRNEEGLPPLVSLREIFIHSHQAVASRLRNLDYLQASLPMLSLISIVLKIDQMKYMKGNCLKSLHLNSPSGIEKMGYGMLGVGVGLLGSILSPISYPITCEIGRASCRERV